MDVGPPLLVDVGLRGSGGSKAPNLRRFLGFRGGRRRSRGRKGEGGGGGAWAATVQWVGAAAAARRGGGRDEGGSGAVEGEGRSSLARGRDEVYGWGKITNGAPLGGAPLECFFHSNGAPAGQCAINIYILMAHFYKMRH